LASEILELLRAMRPVQQITEHVSEGGSGPCSVFGVCENAAAQLAAAVKGEFLLLIVTATDLRARVVARELSHLADVPVERLPQRELLTAGVTAASREMAGMRTRILGRLLSGEDGIYVAGIEALVAPMMPGEKFERHTLRVGAGRRLELSLCARALAASGYERVDTVEGRGQFALRGGILDVFSLAEDAPHRIEFFDDEVDSIRLFDTVSQRSGENVHEVCLYPASEALLTREEAPEALRRLQEAVHRQNEKNDPLAAAQLRSLLEREQVRLAHGGNAESLWSVFDLPTADFCDYLPENALVLLENPKAVTKAVREGEHGFHQSLTVQLQAGMAVQEQASMHLEYGQIARKLQRRRFCSFWALEGKDEYFPRGHAVRMRSRDEISFQGRIDLLVKHIMEQQRRKNRIVVCARSDRAALSLRKEFSDRGVKQVAAKGPVSAGQVLIVASGITLGAAYEDEGLVIIGEHNVFLAAEKRTRRVSSRRPGRIASFAQLEAGDYVVHDKHGVGICRGVMQMQVEGVLRDYLLIEFAKGDKLYVPTEQMDRVQKYIGSDDAGPKLSRLGGSEWANTKKKVAASIEDMTRELAELYAARQAARGHAFSPDTPWQREFEESFPYEETPDQVQCVREIKRDMQSERVMDRLLCGDVGYGKTEVALRAAFKAVADSMQVAVLVPTTLLAQQHYQTIVQRFEGFPVSAALLSRFRTPAQNKKTKQAMAEGTVDIVVGTHSLLAKDVTFRRLGLLVIDEEQRFGVRHKERIKQMRKNVDVLTLSATPIPRTLHMSMVGIRDMSILETPPEGRYPTQTYVLPYQDGIIAEAVRKELARDGQVYIVYNHVQSMDSYFRRLSALVPESRIAMAHGQMDARTLEGVMMDFVEGRLDVLLCSTIIENGLDIPRVNTLIVYDADHFGLAQLYQLRGRVGRSTRLAYAYFTYRGNKALTETAQKRLRTISEFTQFGSGFKIAMRDLEIRGAGNLLGARQHGHMNAVGYELYSRMVGEAVRKHRGEEIREKTDPRIDVMADAYIPDDYITSQALKIQAYQRIAEIQDGEGESEAIDELIDRFGEPPQSVLTLMKIARLRAKASVLGVNAVVQRGHRLEATLEPDAPIDGAKLMRSLAKHKKWLGFSHGVSPRIRIEMPGADSLRLIETAMGLFEEISLEKNESED
jgi:transcription-repair coupling factor (superfamily II helicase)